MVIHKVKCLPWHFEEVISGRKRFEIRLDDRNYQENDMIILREWDPARQNYTGREETFDIPYILRDFTGLAPGYIAMAIVSGVED